jgi:hypothetical protein
MNTITNKIATVALTAVELLAWVTATLAEMGELKGEEMRVALGNLIYSVSEKCPAHFGTKAEKEAVKVSFSSDRKTRKAQLQALDNERKTAKGVNRLLWDFAKAHGLGIESLTYSAARSTLGSVSFTKRENVKLARSKVASIRL